MSLFYLCFKDLLGTKPIQKTLLGWSHILNKRSVDSQLRKWPKHHNEYLSRAHRYANAGLCYFHWQSGLQTETKARFYWEKMLKPRSKKEQGFCLRIWKHFIWNSSEFFPLNRVYLTASESYGENQETSCVEKCFVICKVLCKYLVVYKIVMLKNEHTLGL